MRKWIEAECSNEHGRLGGSHELELVMLEQWWMEQSADGAAYLAALQNCRGSCIVN